MPYMITFTINIPQMLPYMAYMDPIWEMVMINSPVVPVALSSSTSHDDFLGLKELVTEPNRAETGTANFWVQFWQLLLAGQ